MIKSLVAFLILTSAATSFATHAYRSETCVSTTHQLVYNGNYPMGGSYTLTNLKTKAAAELYEKEEAASEGNEFERITGKTLSSKTKKASCKFKDDIDFDEEYSKSQSVISFNKLAQADEAQVGIQSGTYMIFNCSGQFSMPVHCN